MIKLTEWQGKYKTHVDETQDKINTLLDQMKQTVAILDATSGRISKIDENLENIDSSLGGISVSAEDISKHVENLKLQNEVLKKSYEFSRLKEHGNLDLRNGVIFESLNFYDYNMECIMPDRHKPCRPRHLY